MLAQILLAAIIGLLPRPAAAFSGRLGSPGVEYRSGRSRTSTTTTRGETRKRNLLSLQSR
ncbi:unnamed protein product, partial [Laminaria digitata]